MARGRIGSRSAAMTAAALALSALLAGCGAPRTTSGGTDGQAASGRQESRGGASSGVADPNKEIETDGEKVTSETPADPSATDEESGTSRLGAYDSRTNLTADMVPKAAIYPEGGSAEDIARAVVAHMGKKHEGLRVKSAQLKGNGWDKSTGVEGVASWTTYLLDTEEGNIGMQVLCQRDGSLLVSETSILKIDEVNGYDVKKNETVPLASATSEDKVDVLVDFDDVYPMWEGMTEADLPPHQTVPVQKDNGQTVDVTLRNMDQ